MFDESCVRRLHLIVLDTSS